MTKKDIQDRIDAIRKDAESGDSEMAHLQEDRLRQVFLQHVRNDPCDDELGEKAKLVLSTDDLAFERWYA